MKAVPVEQLDLLQRKWSAYSVLRDNTDPNSWVCCVYGFGILFFTDNMREANAWARFLNHDQIPIEKVLPIAEVNLNLNPPKLLTP